MFSLIICVLCGILTFTQGNTLPVLNETPLTISVLAGQTAELPCQVQNLGRATLIWFSPFGSPLATDTVIYAKERYNTSKTVDGGAVNLVIANVTENDAGVYVCMLLSQQAEKRVTLEISSPPVIDIEMSSPTLKTIKEGESLMLRCTATGKPEPTVKWYRLTETDSFQRSREDLGITSSSLMVRNTTRESAGSYQCVASNGLGNDATREIIVTVHFPPVIYPQKDKVTTENSKTAVFECVAEGYPLPNTGWLQNGDAISYTGNRKFTQELYEEKDTLINTLRIDNIDDGDYGIYTCQAENQYGQKSFDFLLEKKGVPKISVESSLIRKLKSENAELVCRVRGFPRSVVWFKNGEEVRDQRRYAVEQYTEEDVTVSSLTIVTLETMDFATYICQAHNNYGSDEMEIRLEKLSIDISGPTQAKLRQEIALICNATTNSIGTDSISWLKNGQPLRASDRISMSRDIDEENKRIYSKLYIRDMKLGDKGSYTCRTKSFLFKSHTLGVIEVPDPFVSIDRQISSQNSMVVNENSGPINVRCAVEGYPRVLISWYKYEGEDSGRKMYSELSSTDEILTLPSDRTTSGVYQCRASNGVQDEETLNVEIDVHYPVKVSVASNRVFKTIGSTLVTECNITGHPITRNFWASTKGANATFDHTLEIVYHENYVSVLLKIMTLRLQDFGTYTCIGGNHVGNDSASVLVSPIFTTTTSSTTTMATQPTTTTRASQQTTTTMAPTTYSVTSTETTTKRRRRRTTTTTESSVNIYEEREDKNIYKMTTKAPRHQNDKTSIPEPEPETTDEPKKSDKELVKQGQGSGDNKCPLVTISQVLVALTILVTFQLF